MPRVADARFVLSDAGHLLAFGFGAGLSRRAPGTVGTLVAFPLFWLLHPRLSDAQFVVALDKATRLPGKELKAYLMRAHKIVAGGLPKKKQKELGLA